MRLRLRVLKDGEPQTPEPASGPLAWLRRWFTNAPPPPPCQPSPKPDHRWVTRGEARYLYAGRLCLKRDGAWRPEYLFDVLREGQLHRIRIVLPEPLVTQWETTRGRRMTEAERLALARETLDSLLDLDRLPSMITVAGDAVAAAGS